MRGSLALVAFDVIEPELTGARVDERLAAGWFPYGQHWMTCRVWPEDGGMPQDTVWVRVRLGPRSRGDRARKRIRDGLVVEDLDHPVFDAEHQGVYERFRVTHPTWRTGPVSGLLLDEAQPRGPLFARTRELALRDGNGRLLAFRWYVRGEHAIAGVTSVYDPAESGLGTLARRLADEHAWLDGLTWTYPGYVRPGSKIPWDYKIREGRTEWLDIDTWTWRPWDEDPPQPPKLTVAELRGRLAPLGAVLEYPRWAAPWFDANNRELPMPWFVVAATEGDRKAVVVWDLSRKRYQTLMVEPRIGLDGLFTLEVVGVVPVGTG
jgi:hypothetical protein